MRRLTSVSVPPRMRDSRLARRSTSSRSASVICENRPPRSTRTVLVNRKSSITDCLNPSWRLPWTRTILPSRPNLRQRRTVLVDTFSRLLSSSNVMTGLSSRRIISWRSPARSAPSISKSPVGVGAVAGDSETDERIRIAFARLDLGKEPSGLLGLLQSPGRRGEPHLLIRQLFQGWIFEASHSHAPFDQGSTLADVSLSSPPSVDPEDATGLSRRHLPYAARRKL